MSNIRRNSVFLLKNSLLSIVMFIVVGLGGCTEQPSDEQLEVWRKEAIARNAEIVADKAKKTQETEWNLTIQGETNNVKTVTLNWQQLQNLATTHVKTTDANYLIEPLMVFDFRGVPVSTLLQKFGYQDGVTEVTFIAYNSYQVTVKLQDLLQYPMILAIANNGKPINRNQGGPIYLVFPHTQYPRLKQLYPQSFWVFYVNNIVVGTEPVRLRIGKQEFNSADLERLPQVTILASVGYRSGWPSGKVKLHGVNIRNVLDLAKVKLTASGELVVQGKQTTYHNKTNPVRLGSAEIQNCDILLVTHWGDDKQPIPAKMGGPVTLAFGSNCQAETRGWRWVTFVEELVIKP